MKSHNFCQSHSLQRYGGELIYSDRDQDGVMEVVETHGVRALHFGSPSRQSALSLRDPQRLELAYIRAMTAPLLFVHAPRTALLIGLGGGSLAKFLWEQFPDCRVEVIERRPGVTKIAHRFFYLPRDERLNLCVADATLAVKPLIERAPNSFDLIMIDAYDEKGMDGALNQTAFFLDCERLLHPLGALSINLWSSHPLALKRSLGLLKSHFPGKAFKLDVPGRGNVIGVGLGKDVDGFFPKRLEPRARELEFNTGLEMNYFLRNLRAIS